MSATFSPFSQSNPRSVPTLRAKAAREKDPFFTRIECAKNYLSTRLALATMLSFNEKVLVQRFGEAIMDGDVERLQYCMSALGDHGSRRDTILGIVAGELHTPGVAFLPLQVARWRFTESEELHEVTVLSIQLINARRIFSIASDDRFGPHVYGREHGITEELNEDPRILFTQIGRMIANGLTSPPPPFSSSTGTTV